MILFANIDRVEKDRDYYVVYTTEAYKEFDFVTHRKVSEFQLNKRAYCLSSDIELVNFIELYKKNTVLAEVLNYRCYYDYNHRIIVSLRKLSKTYNLFCNLWRQGRNVAIEKYKQRERLKEQEIERNKYKSERNDWFGPHETEEQFWSHED